MRCLIPVNTLRSLCFALLPLTLAGCGGGSGEPNQSLPNTTAPSSVNYTGPAPANNDVQQFKLALWDNLVGNNRCGTCHGTDGGQLGFVRSDDINLAYAAANTIVNLNDPAQSAMVEKVRGGHNCWEASDDACADTIVSYIENWAGGAVGNVTQVVLRAPARDTDPGSTLSFPEDSATFSTTVYPLLRSYCVNCHVEGLQTPYLASADADVAYAAAQSRIDLENASASRLVQRLRNDFHNCWGGDCASSADAMQSAIQDFSDTLTPVAIDPALVTSKSLTLFDGTVANSGGRYEDNVIALYEFKTGEGAIAYDTSGVEPALHLTLSGDVNWVGGWGIQIVDGKAQGTTAASRKLHQLITATGEYSIEAWIAPANVTQEDARIISYSGGTTARNVTLGQTLYNYDFLHRSSTTDANGETALSTADADERLQATQQHVVVTFSPGEGRRIYVNGEFTGDMDSVTPGNLSEWDDTFALVLGNEVSSNRLWQGTIRLVAIHNRALSGEQILQNYGVGVGQKFLLPFRVSHHIDVPDSYVVFQVSQFDSHSYLFSRPYFISLDPTVEPGSIPIAGLRLGINGKEAAVGQAFVNVNTTLDASVYEPGVGQPLSSLGTIIALEKGPTLDEFFLTFERLGDLSHVVVEATPAPLPAPPDGDPRSDIGLRTFDEINASMSVLTGVPRTHAEVAATFNTIRQQLPTDPTLEGFLSAQQMAVTQLAIQYCDALVENPTLRATFFPGFSFTTPAGSAFNSTGRNQIIDPLNLHIAGAGLATQPDPADVDDELNDLITRLTGCATGGGATCNTAERTRTVVKASCAAVLGSAVLLIQ